MYNVLKLTAAYSGDLLSCLCRRFAISSFSLRYCSEEPLVCTYLFDC